MKRIWLIMTFAIGLASCNGMTSTTADNTTRIAVSDTCVIATALIDLASSFNAKLNNNQKANVTHAISVLSPVCRGTAPTVATTAYAAFKIALSELAGATAGLKP